MPDLVTLTGVGVSPGVGAGPVVRVVDSVPEPRTGPGAGSPEEEFAAASAALEDVAADLEDRGRRAGGEAQHVLEAQAMMARDPDLAMQIQQRTQAGTNAARAAYEAFGITREMLLTLGEYFAARVTDLDDIRNRTVARLLDVPAPGIPELTEPSILVAMDLAPADTALIDKSMVLAFATQEGGPTSHTSILARNLGIPAVVGCPGVRELAPGTRVLVDGSNGKVVVDPPDDLVARLAGVDEKRRAALAAVGNAPGTTSDGHAVPLLANIGGPEDVAKAVENGAEGVGLFRSELLFLDRTDAPSEDEQHGLYRQVLEGFSGKKVVVRTLDAGADKPLPFLPFGEEPNPAMGVRGLRICMQAPDIMHTQLTALARAAEGLDTELWVMAPMVADVYEARWFREACRKAGLKAKIGTMVEIPAAALRAEHLGAVAEFFSIGSNDLTQYTFAADRQIGAVARLQDAWQPAILDLVAATTEGGAANGIPTGVCGEAAADPALACVLVGLGVNTLSMSAGALPGVRAALAAHTLDDCKQAAHAARSAVDAEVAKAAARACLPALEELGL
ncbi:MAG: phosphoenolpyruvate--protein phosphotransferase [Candidatus Nanopelagicales bacterium]|jgi:phosphotransferase system enzyme I (PtsI)|nr:phosphoenolpyruvate--protein phosphotransferase [Candidatus Nanopelagicales bacterium]